MTEFYIRYNLSFLIFVFFLVISDLALWDDEITHQQTDAPTKNEKNNLSTFRRIVA